MLDGESEVFGGWKGAVGNCQLDDRSAFGLRFSMLAHRDKLLRVKGILHVKGSNTPVAVHAVQHVIHAPEHLPDWPDAERGSRILFITQGLEQG